MSNLDMINTPSNNPSLARVEASHRSYVDWGSILAGAIIAVAIFTLMTTFGAAVGLSAASPFAGKGLSATALGVASGIWVLWVSVSSFVVGGYIAGRMRRRVQASSDHERDVRDGMHGLIVWAAAALLLIILAATSLTGLARVATGAVTTSVGTTLPGTDLYGYAADRLLRSATSSTVTPGNVRQDVAQILAASLASGTMGADDKSYLAAQISLRTGVAAQDAGKRVDDAIAQLTANADKALQAAEAARKIGVLVAFLTAASLAICAAAAWWAASTGGRHRDEAVDLSYLTNWR